MISNYKETLFILKSIEVFIIFLSSPWFNFGQVLIKRKVEKMSQNGKIKQRKSFSISMLFLLFLRVINFFFKIMDL